MRLPLLGYVFVPGTGDTVRFASIELDNDEIIALPSAEIQILAAPGANKIPVLVAVGYELDAASGLYTYDGSAVGLELKIGSVVLWSTLPAGSFNTAARTWTQSPLVSAINGTVAALDNDVMKVGFDNAGAGNLGGGNVANSLKVAIAYLLYDTSTGEIS